MKASLNERTPLRIIVSLGSGWRQVRVEQAGVPLGGGLGEEVEARSASCLPECET